MRAFQGILLAILMVNSFASGGVDNTQVCDAETQVKLSMIAGLRHNHGMKTAKCVELEREVKEAAKTLNFLENELNTTRDDLEELKTTISNIKITPVLHTCDGGIPTDNCCQIKRMLPSAQSGLYVIRDYSVEDEPFSSAKIAVTCDMETDGGGWIVIQRRDANFGRVNFTRSWKDYENGFGDLDGELWIGLKKIYELTNEQRTRLQVSVWNDTNTSVTWNYEYFRISGPENRYSLSIEDGIGSGRYGAFDALYGRTRYFSTYDRGYYENCAYTNQGGWWYHSNCDAGLNGRHQPTDLPGTSPLRQRLVWKTQTGYDIYTHSEMKIRPAIGCGNN